MATTDSKEQTFGDMDAERIDYHQFLVDAGTHVEIVEMIDPDDLADCTCGSTLRVRNRSRGAGFCQHIWAARRAYMEEQEEVTA